MMFRPRNFKAVSMLSALMCLLAVGAAQAQTQTSDELVGDWTFSVEVEGQLVNFDASYAKDAAGKLTGKWNADVGSGIFTNVVCMKDGQLTFDWSGTRDGQEFLLYYEGTYKDGKIEGWAYLEDFEMYVTGKKKAPPVKLDGEWEMTMQMGQRGGGGGGGQAQQRPPAKVIFKKTSAGAFTGEWTGGFGGRRGGQRQGQQRQGAGQTQTALSDIKLVKDKLTFVRKMQFQDNEFSMNFAGTIKGDKITGNFTFNMGQGGEAREMPATLTRVKAKPIPAAVGNFEVKLSVGEQEMTSTLSFTQQEDGSLAGKWSSEMGETELTAVKFEGDKLTFTFRRTMGEQEMVSTFAGTVKGNDLTGALSFGENELQLTGKRKK